MPFKKLTILSFLIFIISTPLLGQKIVKTQDLGFWAEASVDHTFKKDYTVSFSQELRLFESLSEVDKYISQIGLSYKINKNFKLQGNLRFALAKRENKVFSQDYRYNFDLRYKWKVNKDFDLKYRIRFQTKYKDGFLPKYRGSKSDFRHKISADYELSKLHTLGLSGEIWREFELYEKPHFGKIRCILSDEYKASIGDLTFFAGVEKDIDSSTPLTYFITGIAYNISI